MNSGSLTQQAAKCQNQAQVKKSVNLGYIEHFGPIKICLCPMEIIIKLYQPTLSVFFIY